MFYSLSNYGSFSEYRSTDYVYKSNKRQEAKQLQIKTLQIKTNPKWPKIQCFPVPVERPQTTMAQEQKFQYLVEYQW